MLQLIYFGSNCYIGSMMDDSSRFHCMSDYFIAQNEARQDKDVTDDDGVVMSGKGMEKQHSVEDLDRLLQFIEGTDPDDLVKETHQSSKSAKRARQKLRKVCGGGGGCCRWVLFSQSVRG